MSEHRFICNSEQNKLRHHIATNVSLAVPLVVVSPLAVKQPSVAVTSDTKGNKKAGASHVKGDKTAVTSGTKGNKAPVTSDAEGDKTAVISDMKGNKKRRRGENSPPPVAAAKAPSGKSKGEGHDDRKQIVRIRAKVHCTAAGLPGVDAPAKTGVKGDTEDGGDATTPLPAWHPLEKVRC